MDQVVALNAREHADLQQRVILLLLGETSEVDLFHGVYLAVRKPSHFEHIAVCSPPYSVTVRPLPIS